ncbi:MAG: hypothetical protein ACJA0X_000633 [Cyclobacteriaceae bacterium]|jgi:hypothetical protein
MNKIILAFVISIFHYSTILGQDIELTTTLTFDQVSMDDFNYQHDADPEASAVVLFDKGESEFFKNDGLNIRFHRQKRIKILQNAGLDYANIEVPYYVDGYGKKEKIKEISASSYTFIDGQVKKKKVELDEVFIEDINSNWKRKKFTIPDVHVGTIIEYEYTLETPFLINLHDWQFQEFIPTLYSEYTIQSVPFYEYIFLAQGIEDFSDYRSVSSLTAIHSYANVSYPDLRSTYIMKNVPRFIDEGYITSADHYLMKMDFQLAKINYPGGTSTEIQTTWKKINEELSKHDDFGKYIKKSGATFIKYFDNQGIKSNSSAELAENVINTIKQDFNWNGRYGKYASQKTKNLLETKSGNVADINLFLVAALRDSGIKAYPVLVSTRSNGRVFQQYPFSHFFNYVIVYYEIEGIPYMADATEPLLSHYRLPSRCINQVGLLLKDKECAWIDLVPNYQSSRDIYAQYKISPDDRVMDASIMYKLTELKAYDLKKQYKNDTTALIEHLNNLGVENIKNIETFNFDTPKKYYSISVKSHNSLTIAQGQILINPFFKFAQNSNPFKQKERTYPVDLTYPTSTSFNIMIEIPNGYEVSEIPESINLSNEVVHIAYEVLNSDNTIRIAASYSFKKTVYPPEEYLPLKEAVDKIISKFNEYIVLEKK